MPTHPVPQTYECITVQQKGLDMFEQVKGLEMGKPSWITQMGLMGPMRVPLISKQESQSQKETIGQGKQVLE